MTEFEHERLDVYRIAIEFLAVADVIAASLPKGRAYLADQLRRAAHVSTAWVGALERRAPPSWMLASA